MLFTNRHFCGKVFVVIKMEQKKLDRISELTKISRERELTAEEQAERAGLRKEYINSYVSSLTGILDNTYIERPDGTKTKLEKKN